MATKVYRFYGKSHYAKVHQPDDKYGNFQCGLILDKKSMDLFKKSGLQLKLKDVDGEQYVTFRRDPKKMIKGELVDFGKPKVTDAVGRDIEDLVGNGSDVAVTVSVFDTVKGKGHRMDVVQVVKLVPYEGGPQIEDAHEDLDEEAYPNGQPVEEPKEKAKGKPKGQLNDELPF